MYGHAQESSVKNIRRTKLTLGRMRLSPQNRRWTSPSHPGGTTWSHMLIESITFPKEQPHQPSRASSPPVPGQDRVKSEDGTLEPVVWPTDWNRQRNRRQWRARDWLSSNRWIKILFVFLFFPPRPSSAYWFVYSSAFIWMIMTLNPPVISPISIVFHAKI